jgi:hypothetical protein
MRSGPRAVYKGTEYEYIEHEDSKKFELIIRDTSQSHPDFQLDDDGIYIKFVTRAEIDELYYIRQYAKYKGHTFPIWEMNEEQLLLGEGSYTIATEVGFPPSELPWERGLYKKWVSKSDIEAMWEEKKPL